MSNEIVTQKKCSRCDKIKSISAFGNDKYGKDGKKYACRKCESEKCKLYTRTKSGLISRIYSDQRNACKRRKMSMPDYSKNILKEWLFSQDLFHDLYDKWATSGYKKDFIPSVDRKNDYISYTVSNIQLMAWKENHTKAMLDIRSGINNKKNKAVMQLDLGDNFIAEFHSMNIASRITGISVSCISLVCNGKQDSTCGFKWEFK